MVELKAWVPIFAVLIGLVLYLPDFKLAKAAKINEIGRLVFVSGCLVMLYDLSSKVLHLGT